MLYDQFRLKLNQRLDDKRCFFSDLSHAYTRWQEVLEIQGSYMKSGISTFIETAYLRSQLRNIGQHANGVYPSNPLR